MKGAHFYADASIVDLYAWFADETAASSPTWERLCRWIAADAAAEPLRERLHGLPGMKRQPNLFLGAAKMLGAPLEPGTDHLAWVERHWPDVEGVVLTHATQTNEPGRCATLLPYLAGVGERLALVEVGMSAGLCLVPDRYAYAWRRPDGVVDRLGDAGAPLLACDVDDEDLPLPATMPEVVWRAGIDLNPLDPADADDAAWLRALVWPGETEREQRLADCLGAAAGVPVERVAGDALDHLAEVVGRAPRDATVVVFHSAVLAYFSRDDRRRFADLVGGLDVRWVANEGERVVPGVRDRVPPWGGPPSFVLSVDGQPVARTAPHGQWLAPLRGMLAV
ncbi:hypothetical protein GCM10027418_21510 [Mariniluteicoccus endophyticus]